MRADVKTVSHLEYKPLPEEALGICVVPNLPLDEEGNLPYSDLPAHLAAVLGILEMCNIKLQVIENLQKDEQ